MDGNFVDNLRFSFKAVPSNWESKAGLITTDYGNIRVLDTGGNGPAIIIVPDAPNVIEHLMKLISRLSKNFRVICFELPGTGFSYPNSNYDYSILKGSALILHIMDILGIDRATLAFSCCNGFYAIKAAELFPERIEQLILCQTPSLQAMNEWTKITIPNVLQLPIIGQVANSFLEHKLAKNWYRYALPKSTDKSNYQTIAIHSLKNGACFCLSGLVQGLHKDLNSHLKLLEVPSILVWGIKDYTHRETENTSIWEHIPNCEIVEFNECGHFPELEDTDKFVELINERLKK